MKYGTGSIKAELVKDSVKIGSISVKNQIFAQSISVKDFPNLKADGILGLGFSQGRVITIIDNLKNESLLKKRIFSFYLQPKNKAGTNAFPNQFTLGDYDPKFIQKGESLAYCKVTHKSRWVVDLISISISSHRLKNKKSISLSTGNKKALIDSGTSLITFSKKARDEFFNILKKEGKHCNLYLGFIICYGKNLSDYPDIVFNLCGHKMVLNPIDYIETIDNFALIYSQVYDGSGENDFIILGDTFMRKYYSVFNLDEKKIGFALANSDAGHLSWPRL